MELDEHSCLEEQLWQTGETWEAYLPSGVGDFFSHDSGSCFDYCCFDEGGGGIGEYCPLLPNTDLDALGVATDLDFGCPTSTLYRSSPPAPMGAILQLPSVAVPVEVQLPSQTTTNFGPTAPFSSQEEGVLALEGKELIGLLHHEGHHLPGAVQVVSKLEELNQSCIEAGGPGMANAPALLSAAFDVGSSSSSYQPERKARAKKVAGQPSKNLMAERRRRKRLNDRLSMLRSVVPRISKMDRTSILGDTIDYMRDLLDRIKRLQQKMEPAEVSSPASDEAPSPGLLSLFNLLNPNEVLVRNSTSLKFDVERREVDTRVEICCATSPGLLLSVLSTLGVLGLEIQQCVISCFNDFGMQASCSEDMEQRAVVSSEEMKQLLFRNAGYRGKCL